MKRGKRLWIMLLALVLLTGVTVVLSKLDLEGEEEETVETEAPVTLTIPTDTISGLAWTYNEETLIFNCENEEWSYAADEAFTVDSTHLEEMIGAIGEITATKTIEAVEDLSQYGLDEPECIVSVSGGTDSEIRIGDETGIGGERYISIGDGNVYLVDSDFLDNFTYELYDLLKWESIPDLSGMQGLAIDSETKEYMILYMGDMGLSYSDSYGWYMLLDMDTEELVDAAENSGGELAESMETESTVAENTETEGTESGTKVAYYILDTELTEEFVTSLAELSWLDCVNYKADEEALAEYGLDEPTALLTLVYAQTTEAATNEKDADGNTIYEEQTTTEVFIIEIGGYADDGCYARISGSDMVYLIDSSISDLVLYTGYTNLMIDDVLRLDMDTVESVDVIIDNTTYTMVKETTTSADSEGNTTETAVYRLNGNEIDAADILEGINDMESTGYAYGVTPARTEEIRIVFHRNTETFTEVELVFYQYDSSTCLVSLDGETTQFVARTDVTGLVEEIEQAILDSETVEETEAESTEETTAGN